VLVYRLCACAVSDNSFSRALVRVAFLFPQFESCVYTCSCTIIWLIGYWDEEDGCCFRFCFLFCCFSHRAVQ
jgi:hypothetical protein